MQKKLMIQSNFSNLSQFLVFCGIGIFNTGVHYLVFLFLFKIIGIWYLASSAIGYICGMMNSYILNRYVTFRLRYSPNFTEFMKFIVVNLVSMGLNLAVLALLVNFGNLIPEIAQVISILASLFVNFVGNKVWTFSTR